jgi:PTS system nitrogen regulatory IIA component
MQLTQFPAIQSFLHHVTGTAGRDAGSGERPVLPSQCLADLLAPQDIMLDVVVAGKSELLDEIGQHMESVHELPRESVVCSLAHREQIGSTALGQGIAIPHARIKELTQLQLMYLRLKLPIPFGAADGKPVVDVLVILAPKLATQEHLQILADTSELFSSTRFREQLHLCASAADVKQLFDSWPKALR